MTESRPGRASAVTVLLFGALAGFAGSVSGDDRPEAIRRLLRSYHDVGAFNGAALVAANGKVIFKEGFGLADFEWSLPNTADTKFRLGSITKQFTATVVMQLTLEGKLSRETTLAAALPYYRQDTGKRVTIHSLLNHTSGIPSYTSLPNFGRDVMRNAYEVREFVEKYCSGDLEFEVGTKFRYSNSGYFLLGAIIEQATGKTYEEALRERIFEPLGMHASGYDHGRTILPKRARGYEMGLSGVRNADYLDMSPPYSAGALYSTVEDLYLWDQALYGDRVLPQAAKETMFTPGLEHYGYGWAIRKAPIGPGKAERLTLGHGGGINGFGTLITRVPEDRHLVVLLNNTGGTGLDAMFAGIADILYGRTPSPARRPVARALYETITKAGVAAGVARYREIKAGHAEEFDLGEPQLNRLGYELLGQKMPAEAIEIFKLNVEAFPASANTYDSLAEAYMKDGQNELAIKNYEKTLELSPGNAHAAEMLKTLKR